LNEMELRFLLRSDSQGPSILLSQQRGGFEDGSTDAGKVLITIRNLHFITHLTRSSWATGQ
ncbi:MAG: hypothetical protein Q7S99_02825, partial [Parvibaculum sp.]|nr:hypothetical protein [Parvibaculum sp.]